MALIRRSRPIEPETKTAADLVEARYCAGGKLTTCGSSSDFVHVHTADHGAEKVEHTQPDIDGELIGNSCDASAGQSASEVIRDDIIARDLAEDWRGQLWTGGNRGSNTYCLQQV